MADDHPIFDDIERGDLEAVRAHVLADATVLEEQEGCGRTSLVYTIHEKKLALSRAPFNGHSDIAALLRRAVAEPDRARTLHKARSLLDASHAINKAHIDAREKGEPLATQQQNAIAAAPTYLKDRVECDEALPKVKPSRQTQKTKKLRKRLERERLRDTVAFVSGMAPHGLPEDLFAELMEYMLPKWADKGPEVAETEQEA